MGNFGKKYEEGGLIANPTFHKILGYKLGTMPQVFTLVDVGNFISDFVPKESTEILLNVASPFGMTAVFSNPPEYIEICSMLGGSPLEVGVSLTVQTSL
jgi:hypothetical protein